jgi:diguanylate cyclase (GGDEF)-like protein
MMRKRMDWSATGWSRVVLVTVLGTLACIGVATYVDSFTFATKSPDEVRLAILLDVLVPLFLAGPLLLFFTAKLRELAIANARMTILASTDSLTAVLNRGAFTMLVEAYLAEARNQEHDTRGALLVVDADHFKAINDSHGHDRGDDALKIIASSIQAVLRGADIVGRIGGEEFGVFLPGATPQVAETVAERIRASVHVAEFVPTEGTRAQLSVSVGGATFNRRVGFTDLFRLADERLYDAKGRGRNRVSIAALGPVPVAA